MKRVVITGMGVIAPMVGNKIEFLQMLKQGMSGITFIPELKELNFACQIGGIAKLPETGFPDWFTSNFLEKSSLFNQYACLAAVEAWQDSKLELPPKEDQEVNYDTGSIIGTGMGPGDVIGELVSPLVYNKNVRRIGSLGTQNTMMSSPSAYLSGILALGNQCSANSSACSSGLEAIIEGYQRIKDGYANRMLCGGSESCHPVSWASFDSLRVLNNTSNDTPEIGSRPMSESAAGFVPGGGAGILVLEELESALSRNCHIYAEILGAYVNSGGHRQGGSMTFPNYNAVEKCIWGALHSAKLSPNQIDLISGHLTGTKADPFEIKHWNKIFTECDAPFPFINSTKSMIGHSLGAAGSIESIAAILELEHGFIHPSINCEDVHPDIPEKIANEKIPHKMINKSNLHTIVKASFGFGDVNAVAVFRKWNN